MYLLKTLRPLVLLAFLLWLAPLSLSAQQDLLKGKDLSKVKVDDISNADILKLNEQLKQSSIPLAQFEQMATVRGMQSEELAKLRERLSRINTTTGSKTDNNNTTREQVENEFKTIPKPPPPAGSTVFGSQLFGTTSLSFEPNLRIATPQDYLLGPDDELSLNIFGVQEANFKLQVQPEGNISIPQVGQLHIAGLTVEDAGKLIRQKLIRTVYKSITSGATNLTITLSKIKSIHITIIGGAKPGNYTVSSLTTLFNALYLCGGPDAAIGSYREIELVRNSTTHLKVDLYKFLLNGDTRQNVLLHEGDVINIPVYKKRVRIEGEVKRPGIFEMLDKENINQLVTFAGGFTEKAYTANIKLTEFSDKERRVRDIGKEEYERYIPSKGDSIIVEPVLNRFENRVVIKGAVYRPGQFELVKGLTLKTLIQKADGLKEDAYLQRGLIARQRDDLTIESIRFSVSDVLNDPAKDLQLKREDLVTIASIFDLTDSLYITISGEIRKSGIYPYKTNYSLRDLLFEAGGFTDAATPYRVEISRRVNKDAPHTLTDRLAEVIEVDIQKDFQLQEMKMVLQPYDLVTVRRNPAYFEQKQVGVRGEVLYPGNYTIQSKKERISDLLKRAGGFTTSAYPEAASLIRQNSTGKGIESTEKAKSLLNKISPKDSTNVEQQAENIVTATAKIALNMTQIMANPNSADNLLLEEGDMLDIPKKDELVKISGEVYFPTRVRFEEGKSLRYFLERSGGTTYKALRKNIFVVYANGQVAKTKHIFLGLVRTYPVIHSGAEIIVPASAPKRKATTGELIGIGGILVSLFGVVVTVINTLNK